MKLKKPNNTVTYNLENSYMDQTSLGDLHGYFDSTKKRKEYITTQQLRRREAQLIEEVKFYKQKKDKEKELLSINNKILSGLCLEYTDLKHKAVTKDLQVFMFRLFFSE